MKTWIAIHNHRVIGNFSVPDDFIPLYAPESGYEAVQSDEDIPIGSYYVDGSFATEVPNDLFRPRFNALRDRLFVETEWVRQRHEDRIELGIDDSDNWNAWLGYWQALRDLPNQPGFNADVPLWPERPE